MRKKIKHIKRRVANTLNYLEYCHYKKYAKAEIYKIIVEGTVMYKSEIWGIIKKVNSDEDDFFEVYT